jgi:[ribosomal protein S5]-alanine N-acetyltransferase
MNYFLESEKIYLRAFTMEDIPIWYTWFNDPAVTEHVNKGFFPNTAELQEGYFHAISKSDNDVQLAVVLKENDLLVGIIGIHKIDWLHRRGDISVFIGDKAQWGKGIATEAISLAVKHAFLKLNLRKVTAGMWSSNIGCKRSFEKNYFALEGTLKKQFFCKGSYVDEYRMGLFKEEWESRAKI